MTDIFKTKTGFLTHYALACGYVQEFNFLDNRLTLWHEGGPSFHVRCHDFGNSKRVFWLTFDNLKNARIKFKQTVKQLKGATK